MNEQELDSRLEDLECAWEAVRNFREVQGHFAYIPYSHIRYLLPAYPIFSMNIRDYFTRIREDLTHSRFDSLLSYELKKPEFFNWVEEIFYELNVKPYPDDHALIWCYKDQEIFYSFKDIYQKANQLLNFLRKHGAKPGDRIYSLLPLVPANWISFLATIKGGFILIPTATNLAPRDLVYRYESLFPEIVIADSGNADKIDQAEKEFGQQSRIKILVEGRREGWLSMDDMVTESMEADVAQTRADDPVLYFFTSGTTGMPKIVVHTHFTYPVGHLSTVSWLGCSYGDVHYNISSPGWAKFAWSSFFAPWNTGATIFA
ncbi:MAG: AMP-binding protein, partial [Bacteroidota bacterium]